MHLLCLNVIFDVILVGCVFLEGPYPNHTIAPSLSAYLLPVYTAEKCVGLDVRESRLDLATQSLLGILLGPKQTVI